MEHSSNLMCLLISFHVTAILLSSVMLEFKEIAFFYGMWVQWLVTDSRHSSHEMLFIYLSATSAELLACQAEDNSYNTTV
jgi:hypothetical protein